jgi:hypothetical protein
MLERLSSPNLTLHRSWMLCDPAFGQSAKICRRSGSLVPAILFDQPSDIAAAGSTAGLAFDPQGWDQ